MEAFASRIGGMVAGGKSNTAAAGLILASSVPLNLTSISAPAASVYTVTLTEGIGTLANAPFASAMTDARTVIIAQTGATTFTVTGSDLAVPAAGDSLFSFGVWRTGLQAA